MSRIIFAATIAMKTKAENLIPLNAAITTNSALTNENSCTNQEMEASATCTILSAVADEYIRIDLGSTKTL